MNHPLVAQSVELDLHAVFLTAAVKKLSAPALVERAYEVFGDRLVMSTSFGIQSAVMLHLVTQVVPQVPVIWIDTGYLFPETYRFAEQLTESLELNLKVFQSSISPARMEALEGKLWSEDSREALDRYDFVRKVEPMQRALESLDAQAWLTGLRSRQTTHRGQLKRIHASGGYWKILPILHWSSRDVHDYLTHHQLPVHPLSDKGYVSVGDWHSSRPLQAGDTHDRDTRFRGIKQECGLHLDIAEEASQSFDSSGL